MEDAGRTGGDPIHSAALHPPHAAAIRGAENAAEREQGYYFSKPRPYDEIIRVLRDKHIEFETPEDRAYYHELNRVNVLSPSPFNVKEKDKESHGGGIPLAIIEERRGSFQFLYENE